MMRARTLASTAMATLTMLASAMAFTSLPAYSSTQVSLLKAFGEEGVGAGQFSSIGGLAVDQSSGDVYVVDTAGNRIEKFTAAGEYLTQFDGGPTHTLVGPSSVAVDGSAGPSSGTVYVTDVGNKVVDLFDSAGHYLSQLTGTPTGEAGAQVPFTTLRAVTVDPAGNIWVYEDNEGGVIDEFTSGGSYVGQFTTGRGLGSGIAVDASSNVYVLFGCGCLGRYNPAHEQQDGPKTEQAKGEGFAFDQAANRLYFNQGRSGIAEYDAEGNLLGRFGEEEIETGTAIAVDSTSGRIYAVDASSEAIDIFGRQTLPDIITGVASSHGGVATLSATIDPGGIDASFYFEYGAGRTYGSASPAAPGADVGAGSGPVTVHTDVSGIPENVPFHYRVVAVNANGTAVGDDGVFTIPAAPEVLTGAASEVTQNTANIGGTIDPLNIPAAYVVEFGPTTSYGERAVGEAGSGPEAVPIGANLPYLQPGITYHYRVAATNSAGTSYGEDRTFTTLGYVLGSSPALPLVAPPRIAFPKTFPSSPAKPKSLTKAQKLARALKVCKAKAKLKRKNCEASARRRYSASSKSKQRKS
jgi:hypothetical protein